jgi:hypothetical protein
MKEQLVPCTTAVGTIQGRDAFFLDAIEHAFTPVRVRFRGELNNSLCSAPASANEFTPYILSFYDVLAFKMEEIDFSTRRNRSSFAEVKPSLWLEWLDTQDKARQIVSTHKHFFLVTYDYIFDIIAKRYELDLTEANNCHEEVK